MPRIPRQSRGPLPHLLEVHYDATFLHHGVLLVVIHQVGQRVEPLAAAHVVFTVLLEENGHSLSTETTNLNLNRDKVSLLSTKRSRIQSL